MDRIDAALRTVIDPDIGINIVDLGLVEHVDAGPPRVHVGLIMTSPVCPQGDYIAEQCRQAVAALGLAVAVEILDEPEWDPSRMSPGAQAALGWDE